MFHDAGLGTPFSDLQQRFEVGWTPTSWRILAVHPRGDFKNEFLRTTVDGLKNRPETTIGTVNSDYLEHFVPGFRRVTTVERIVRAPWPS
ncbi:hypothetical protein [Micromonospora sp. NPDC049107]|uniref:hypothetical protein n=1 Tax=Micromonospora sp. NPDC049107 TaxID=3154349 RepID=UPI0033CEB335